MDFGFYRVAAAIPSVKVADCRYNADRMISLIHQAGEKGVELLCFPELSITAYTCGDLFHQHTLLDEAKKQLDRMVRESLRESLLFIVGMPLVQGNCLFNCAVFIHHGTILGVVPKTFLPNYGEFYEKRWFSPAGDRTENQIELCGQQVPFGSDLLFRSGDLVVGAEICEDLWVPVPPSSKMVMEGANLVFNLSASNELIGKNAYLQSLIIQQSARGITAYVYASAGHGESSTDLVFAGNGYIAENGVMLSASHRFSDDEQLIINEIDIQKILISRHKNNSFSDKPASGVSESLYRIIPFSLTSAKETLLYRNVDPAPFVPSDATLDEHCEDIFAIQVAGLAKRLQHTGIRKVVVGISGGLDSTLALLVAVKTFDRLGLPRTGITGITMPGFGTTDRTYRNAMDMMKHLKVSVREIRIGEACNQHFKDIGHDPAVRDAVYENTQARERTQILMDVANQENALVLGTGDLSELALGWATYNGDHMSMYGVNAGIPKTLVKSLILWVASHRIEESSGKILADVADTPVSPELLPADAHGNIAQKTEEIVGPYVLHDFFLYYTFRFGFSPSKIFFLAQRAFSGQFDAAEIKNWLQVFYRRFFSQQYKRSCLPDGPKVGSVNLSPRGDWRMPSDASVSLWLDESEKL